MKFFSQLQIIKKIVAITICLGLLWSFHDISTTKSEINKSIAKNFSDENSDSDSNEESFEPQDLALNCDENYIILKTSTKNFGFTNQLPISGFTLSIATPPPNFLG